MLVLRRNLKGSDKLSKITLKQGNCFDYLSQIPSNSVDLVLTDPPYLISKKSNFDKGGGRGTTLLTQDVEKHRLRQSLVNGIKRNLI